MRTSHATLLATLLTLAVSSALPALAATPAPPAAPLPDDGGPNAIWRNPQKSPDERAKDLLPRLTLEEKIALLHGDGTFTHAGIPRLNIPKTWMDDGPQGVREEVQSAGFGAAGRTDDFSTALPADIALAATFDTDMAKAYGNVIGEEAKTRGKNIMLCPAINIMRTPLNGRSSEYLGEDPYLTSRMVVNFVNGIQQNGVSACVKHYALNNQETNRNSVNAKADERTMREIYLPGFKAAITEGHAWSLMTSYNRINGEYASENEFLINEVLKKDWNFQGLVMTDWGGAHSTVNAALHGLDLEMGTNAQGGHANDYLAAPLLAAVQAGQVPMSRVDDMALRNLRVMAFTGVLNPPADSHEFRFALMSPDHIEAARKIAEGGIVLLKNDNAVLPLDSAKIKSIAIIGDNAKAKFAHDGNSAQIKTSYEITPFDGITKRAGDAMKITYSQGYARPAGGRGGRGRRGAPGAPPAAAPAAPNAQALIDEAVAAAKASDVAIVVAGLYRNQDQEGADRPNMNLPPGQAELIAAVAAANPKTIVILNGGSPSVVSPWIDNTPALLMYWYGGTEGGNALARILFGDVSPSGHLPCSWPKQLADSPAHNSGNPMDYPGVTPQPTAPPAGAPGTAAPAPGAAATPGGRGRGGFGGGRGPLTPFTGPQETYSEGILVGYRWFDAKNIAPQFPFGFGLSYTSFQFSDLLIAMSRVAPGADMPYTAGVSCTLTNTGPREGAAVVQVYISQDNPSVQRAPKELKAFTKASLKPGERKQIALDIPPSAFTHYDPAQHAWIAEPGDYTIAVGDSSRNLPLKATFKLTTPILIKEGQ